MSTPDVELIRSDDPAWDERLEVVAHDVYHRAGYHRFAEATEGTSAFLAVIRGSDGARGVVWPYLLRSISDVPRLEDAEGSDVDSVYGYPGPLAWGCKPGDGFTRGAVDAIVAVWRSQGALSAFTRFHPLLGNERWGADVPAVGPDTGPSVLELGETVAIDLRQDNDAAVGAYSKSLRQEIASARRAGMTTHADEAWAAIGDFTELYRATMLRTHAAGSYFFSVDDFRTLKLALGSKLHLLISDLEGQPAAAGLFTEHDGIVQAHLVGTNDEFRALSPLKLLLDDARSWASERGNTVLHLGGGRGGHDDSLLAFKRRFSPQRHRFSVGRWVLEPGSYAALTSTWMSRIEHDGHRDVDPDFFPTYRSLPRDRGFEFRVVSPGDRPLLAELFADIDDEFFRPHPFTDDEAGRLANYSGRDVYSVLSDDEGPVAYGMLRGWDEGYVTPSLGIAVRRSAKGRGMGRRMMDQLHAEARRRGARTVRLRVHPDNETARRLYEGVGYTYRGLERGELVMVLDLTPSPEPRDHP